jgi:hypothetical protein
MPTKSKWYRGEAVYIPVKDTIKHTGVIALGPHGLEYRRWIEDEAQGRKMLRSIRGIGIDTALMNDLEKRGVQREVIHFGGILYSAEWPTFRKYAIQRDFGYNPQHILPLGYWKAEPAPALEIGRLDFGLGVVVGIAMAGLVFIVVKALGG